METIFYHNSGRLQGRKQENYLSQNFLFLDLFGYRQLRLLMNNQKLKRTRLREPEKKLKRK